MFDVIIILFSKKFRNWVSFCLQSFKLMVILCFFFLLFGLTTLDEDSDADKSPAPFTKRAKIVNPAVYYSLHVVK